MSKAKTILMLSAVLMLVVGQTQADDLFAPYWAETDNSLFAEWHTWDVSGEPDDWEANPVGLDVPMMFRMAGGELLADYEGRTDVLMIMSDDEVEFHLDNYNNDNPEKWIRIQITYYVDVDPDLGLPEGFPLIAVDVWTDMISDLRIDIVPSEIYDHDDGWYTVAYDFILEPNPAWETIGLKFLGYPAYVDQVVIDTKCVPEPAAMSLLVLGGIGVLLRRRRRA